MRGKARLGAACLLFLLSLCSTRAGPVNRASRMLNSDAIEYESTERTVSAEEVDEESTKNITETGCDIDSKKYSFGDVVPSSKLCEECTCTENGVQCASIICEVKAGCKALHRADHCCPLYQCECERNGVIYSNGEKLIDPENPCQVCYCQGGEIVCNQIACFRRDDCEPRYVLGRCCPEYDHCPPRDKPSVNTMQEDTLQKIGPNKITDYSTSTNSEDDKFTTENIKQYVLDDNTNIPLNTDEKINKPSSSNRIVPTLNIIEVTNNQDKPLQNEIRIKEIIPVINNEFSSSEQERLPILLEVSQTNESDEDTVASESTSNTVQNAEDKNETQPEFQTPPILKIGDQLFFLNHGDLIPDNSSVNTPAPVFTVVGAEGLQRVIDEPEEDTQNDDNLNEFKKTLDDNDVKDSSTNNSPLSTEYIEHNVNQKIPHSSENSEENAEKMLEEVEKELYASTTVGYEDSYGENDNIKNVNHVKRVINVFLSPSDADSSNEASGLGDLTTVEPQIVSDRSVEQILEEEQQPIPIEHLPEHNPEYPPIPEDIMILGMTEDSIEPVSSEIEYSGYSPIVNQEKKNDEIISVRNVANLSQPDAEKEVDPRGNERIVPEIFNMVRKNKTHPSENNTAIVPEEWLKADDENKKNEEDKDDKNVSLQLSGSVVLSPSYKDSKEVDDSEDFIFVGKNIPTNSPEIRTETVTTEPLETTEETELKGEYRSPGEPLLIPEWERNIASEVPDDMTTSQNFNESDNLTEMIFASNSSFDYQNKEEELDIGTNIFKNENYIAVEDNEKPKNGILSRRKNIVSLDAIQSDEITTNDNYKEDENEMFDSFTEDPITNLIISTENLLDTAETDDIQKEVILPVNKKDLDDDEYDPNLLTIKQKKDQSLNKNQHTPNESEKKGNILADLISLVGDVASIGNHEAELSTVHNSIDQESYPVSTVKTITTSKPVNEIQTTDSNLLVSSNMELSEYTSEGKNDEIPLENDKVEFTTKKMYIDKDSDGKTQWKTNVDHIKDVEIIPKVENKPKNSSLEKIKQSEKRPVQTTTKTILTTSKAVISTESPKTVKLEKERNINKNIPQTTTIIPKKIGKVDLGSSELHVRKISDKNIAQKVIENIETTIIPTQKTLKLTTKSDITSVVQHREDKLTKREAGSQLAEPSGQMSESLINIFRYFIEKQYKN